MANRPPAFLTVTGRISRSLLIAVAGALLVAAVGCGGGGEAPTPDIEDLPVEEFLVANVSTDKPSYEPGQPVTFTLVLENRASQSLTLDFATCQRYDFFVLLRSDIAWQWSADETFCQTAGEETLDAGDKLTYSETWDQLDSAGQQVPAGSYLVRGAIQGCIPERNCTPSDTTLFDIAEPTG
jgi:hypothetical protein